uniref:tRNA synthetases class I catalytic domain-containing protein n=1 Tax=Ciona intestinalis TaxID=7719 RepID=F6VII8_CIOIN
MQTDAGDGAGKRNLRKQPEWEPPSHSNTHCLKLFNSLTRQKEVFIPENGNFVKWYSCGPTVYDASHMGHARSYISFDILRRVLMDYFGYNVLYCMNITDIDDKIITRARHNYLVDEYLKQSHSKEEIITDVSAALEEFSEKLSKTDDPDKKVMMERLLKQATLSVDKLKTTEMPGEAVIADVVNQAKDPVANWLDKKHGAGVTDNSIFSALPQYWEREYFEDMDALNVSPPDVLTRVSDYVPEIVKYVEEI